MLLTRHVFRPVIGKGKNPGASLWANTNFRAQHFDSVFQIESWKILLANLLWTCSEISKFPWKRKSYIVSTWTFIQLGTVFGKKITNYTIIRLVVVRSVDKCVKFQLLKSHLRFILQIHQMLFKNISKGFDILLISFLTLKFKNLWFQCDGWKQ